MIKGLIFDLDGVITETARLHYLAWKTEVAKIGIDYNSKENDGLKGLSRIETLKAILKNHHMHLDEEEILKMANSKNQLYLKKLENQLSKKDILPKIEELLKDAKAANLKMAIASSSFNASLILEKIGLKKYFDFIVDPQILKKGKPHPEIFIRAAEGLQLQLNEVIGFEDAIAGIEALKSANIRSVAITHNSLEDFSQANLVYQSTNDLNLENILNFFNKYFYKKPL